MIAMLGMPVRSEVTGQASTPRIDEHEGAGDPGAAVQPARPSGAGRAPARPRSAGGCEQSPVAVPACRPGGLRAVGRATSRSRQPHPAGVDPPSELAEDCGQQGQGGGEDEDDGQHDAQGHAAEGGAGHEQHRRQATRARSAR